MRRLEPRDHRELKALEALCARPTWSMDLREKVGARAARHLGADGYCFVQIDPSTALPLHVVDQHPNPASPEAFATRAFGRSPLVDFAVLARTGHRAFRVADVVADQPRKDPFVQELVQALGYDRSVHLLLSYRGLPLGMLAVFRTDGRPDFTDAD